MNLSEDDVPGAKLKFSVIKDNTVADLKRWLACRSLPLSGTKSTLIDRVQACIKNRKSHVIFVGIDNGVWWQKKYGTQSNKFVVNKTPSSTTCSTGWRSFPSIPIPRSFCYGIIQEFITSSNFDNNASDSYDTDEEFIPVCGNSKCLQRGRLSFKSGHVQHLEDSDRGSLYNLRANVLSSYKSNISYKVHIILDDESKVVDAGCHCKASESKSCSHIIGLLLALEDYVLQFGFDPPTCTSKVKEWNKGRKRGNNPQNILVANYKTQVEGAKRNSVAAFDPNLNSPFAIDPKEISSNFLIDLQSLKNDSMWAFLLEINYEDYILSGEEELLLKEKVTGLLQQLSPTVTGPFEISVEQTSQAWHNERRLRITASECKKFFTAKDLTNSIRQKLWSGEGDISHIPQIAYGRKHEDEAFQEYAILMNVPLRKTGFFINSKYPGLGCSPDGLILSEDGKIEGLLEIKCSPKFEFCSPFDWQNLEKPEETFFTVFQNEIHLKRNHPYYYQIQLSLAILEIDYSDFIVWSKNCPSAIERIYKDDSFISSLTAKLLIIQKNICAEFFEMRLPRQLSFLQIYTTS